jgi:hypothetical protein
MSDGGEMGDTQPQVSSGSVSVSAGTACRNHADVPAIDRCAGCAEPFCGNCLVEVQGRKYCGSCKVMAVQGKPIMEAATIPCREAGSALTKAIIGIFVFGIILGPMAISQGLKAKKLIAADPRLTGSGKATAAITVGSVELVLWALGLMARFAGS